MNKTIYFLSAFFPSFAGGAEKSILEEFKLLAADGFTIKAISFDALYPEQAYDFGAVTGRNEHLGYREWLTRSRFLFLFLNRQLVNKILEINKAAILASDFVVLQGPYTPFLAAWCRRNNIPYHYYLRDNTSINLFPNYAKGVRRLFKYLKLGAESPLIIDFKISNAAAIRGAARLIANSDKMAELLHQRFGRVADAVIYPKINVAEIKNVVLNPAEQKYITLMGGRDSEKGYDIFTRAAKLLPEYDFLVVEKRAGWRQQGNVTYVPEQKDVREIYALTKIAISISRWNKDFSGRVGLEAGRLKIPVISSSPVNDLAVDPRKVYVLKNVDDVDDWARAIRSFEEKRGLFILNSDFGVRNTIGARASQIYKALPYKNAVTIFCRNFCPGIAPRSLIKKVIPRGEFIMKLLNGLHIYASGSKYLNLNKIKIELFQWFLLRKLKRFDLRDINFAHSWDWLPKVYSYLKTVNPKIKIVQDVPVALTSLLAEKIKNKPSLNEIYAGVNLTVDTYILESLKYIDGYIAPSAFVKDSLVFEGVAADKIQIIPFGVDAEIFKPRSEKKINQTINFCFAGAINNRKGIPYLIKAWKQLNPPNARLLLYGRVYPEARVLLSDAARYNIRAYGFIDIKNELPKNGVYIFPSILEGSAKSVYEALACGLPAITTYHAGSIVEDGVSGFIVPVADADALAEKIKYFLNYPETIYTMGRAARARALEFSWARYGEAVARIYQ